MFGSTPKPSLGLSINTTAASGASSFGAAANPAAGGSLGGFGPGVTAKPAGQGSLFGSAPSSQPAQGGGLFGSAPSQPASGGLFGATNTSPAPTGSGLFGSAPSSQPATSGGLFGSAPSQPPQPSQSTTGGLLGATTTSSAPTGPGLFGSTSSAPLQSGGLFGSAPASSASGAGLFASSQPSQGGSLFQNTSTQAAPAGGLFGAAPAASQGGGLGGTTTQPSQSLFGNSQAPQQTGLWGGLNQGDTTKPAGSLSLGQQPATSFGTSSTRIDLDHLRPTTKFDQLTEDLQKEILGLDNMILNEINRCNEVSNLLPTIAAAGSNIPNDVAYVSEKLEEVELGLENDADAVQNFKEHTIKKDANEAKLCFREGDRLKMPSQYRAATAGPTMSLSSGIYGGHGLSGWWNHPQTLQSSVRGGPGGGSRRALQLPGGEDENGFDGPANLVDFFDRRAEEMKEALADNKSRLIQVEDFVTVVEGKIAVKQREVIGREEGRVDGVQDEDEVGLLRYVFGEFERSLYDVADKVGAARDGVRELVLGASGPQGRL